jgi:hypothetical protein
MPLLAKQDAIVDTAVTSLGAPGSSLDREIGYTASLINLQVNDME